jgi:hypothetical protein
MESGGIIVEVDGSYSHIFLDCLHPWDILFLVSIKYLRLLHLWSLSQEDCFWLLGDTIPSILLLEGMDEFGYLIP